MRKLRHTVVKATSPLLAALTGSRSGDGAEMLGPQNLPLYTRRFHSRSRGPTCLRVRVSVLGQKSPFIVSRDFFLLTGIQWTSQGWELAIQLGGSVLVSQPLRASTAGD